MKNDRLMQDKIDHADDPARGICALPAQKT
jgi:hypothetical protein